MAAAVRKSINITSSTPLKTTIPHWTHLKTAIALSNHFKTTIPPCSPHSSLNPQSDRDTDVNLQAAALTDLRAAQIKTGSMVWTDRQLNMDFELYTLLKINRFYWNWFFHNFPFLFLGILNLQLNIQTFYIGNSSLLLKILTFFPDFSTLYIWLYLTI